MAGLMKLDYRRVGRGPVEFETVVKEYRRLLKQNQNNQIRFEVRVEVYESTSSLAMIPQADPQIDQTASAVLSGGWASDGPTRE